MIYASLNNNRRLGGNLGNMTMRVMSLMGLAKRYNTTFAIPTWEYAKYFENNIPQLDRITIHKTVKEPRFDCCFDFLDTIDWTRNVDLQGFFQSPLYWHERLRFKTGYIGAMRQKYNFNTQPIAISVRRGDFVGHHLYFQLPLQYYVGALIEHFSDYAHRGIFIFSDDQKWCKEHFDFLENVTFIDAPDIEQLCVLSLCSDFIISNSTFSFVGAYLADRGKVIRPVKNFDGEYAKRHNERDFWPAAWGIYDHRKTSTHVE